MISKKVLKIHVRQYFFNEFVLNEEMKKKQLINILQKMQLAIKSVTKGKSYQYLENRSVDKNTKIAFELRRFLFKVMNEDNI